MADSTMAATVRVSIRIPTPLRGHTGGADEVAVAGDTVLAALSALGRAHEGILDRVLAPGGELRPFVNVYLGAQNVRVLNGLATPLADGDVLSIVPAVAGGNETTPTLTAFAVPLGGAVRLGSPKGTSFGARPGAYWQ